LLCHKISSRYKLYSIVAVGKKTEVRFKPHNAALAALCVTYRAVVQPTPQLTPALTASYQKG